MSTYYHIKTRKEILKSQLIKIDGKIRSEGHAEESLQEGRGYWSSHHQSDRANEMLFHPAPDFLFL